MHCYQPKFSRHDGSDGQEYLAAMHSAEKINMPDLFWDPMLRASALGHLNRIAESGENLERVRKLLPDADEQVKNIIESFLLSTGLHAEILQGLKKAGLISTYPVSGGH